MPQDISHPTLDGVIWRRLTTDRARFANRCGRALRYPATVAPFVALADGHRAIEVCRRLGFVERAPLRATLMALAP